MKDHSPTRRETFWAWCVVGLILVAAVLCIRWMNLAYMREGIKEEGAWLMPKTNGATGQILERGERRRLYWTNHPTLTARNVKPSKQRALATAEEREAMDLMREGDFEAAGKILDEAARQPEPWLVELRKRIGVTNPEALVGPSWEEIEELNLDVVQPAPQTESP